MKTLFSFSSLVTMIITGIASFRLFEKAHYDVSALLTITSFLSITIWVAIISDKKALLN
jgi:hypothetical protein